MKAAVLILAAGLAYGQGWQGNEAVIQMNIRGGGSAEQGKCTAEVEVDGVAEVGIRASEGRIRTISGQPATWRRLDCTGPLPSSFADFRFKGVDGRGRQTLIVDPRNNRGLAVVRIEDPQGGREGYTFDLEWRGGTGWTASPGSGWGGGSGWGTGGSGSGWGSGGGSGWGSGGNWGGGWGSGWGNTFSYSGRGRGAFSMDSGQSYDLRGASVMADRNSGEVQIRFASGFGGDALQFRGRLERVSADAIEARLTEGINRGDAAPVDARARILLRDANRVRSILIDGRARNERFRVNYNE